VDRNNFELAILAMRNGAATVIPSEQHDVQEWVDTFTLAKSTDSRPTSAFIFVDPVSRNMLALTERVAKVDITVMLSGATGCGKEVIAKIIHDASPRHSGPFVAFNCAAMPENLIEDMLFGHDKGSFTGATNAQLGLFEQAQGGTIFLDEVGEMPIHLQAKLLRVLQERSVTRLGGQKAIELDIRVVAATNRNLKQAILDRSFREDLYFRLSAFKITLPNLMERPLDIIPLAEQFILEQATINPAMMLSENAKGRLIGHHWPGNVRELQNVITRAMVMAQEDMIDVEHLIFDDITSALSSDEPSLVKTAPAVIDSYNLPSESLPDRSEPLVDTVRNSEYRTIMSALDRSRNRDQAAEVLGISTRTLRHKLQRLREQGLSVTRAYAR
jgi:two-component system response regulator FlrC